MLSIKTPYSIRLIQLYITLYNILTLGKPTRQMRGPPLGPPFNSPRVTTHIGSRSFAEA